METECRAMWNEVVKVLVLEKLTKDQIFALGYRSAHMSSPEDYKIFLESCCDNELQELMDA